MAVLIFPIFMLSLAVGVGSSILNWLRTELHFRSGDPHRMLVGVLDTGWAERRVILPAGMVSVACVASLALFVAEDRSMYLLVVGMLLLVNLAIGATLVAWASRVNRLQVSRGVEDSQVSKRERTFLQAMRVEVALAGSLLVFVGLFLAD